MNENAGKTGLIDSTEEAPKETLEECLFKVEKGERYVAFLHDVKTPSQAMIIWQYELMRQLPPRSQRTYTIDDLINTLYEIDSETGRYKWKKGEPPRPPNKEVEERISYLRANMGQFYGPETYFTSLIILKNEYGYLVP